MADLAVQVRLTAQDGGLVGQLRVSKAELDGLAASEQKAAVSSRELAGATDRVGDETKKLTADVRELTGAIRTATSAEEGAIAAKRRLAQAQNDNEKAARREKQAYLQLGQQVQDFSIQVMGGVNPLVALAQQGSQAAFVAKDLGGTVGSVARFFAGGWGSAVLIGASVLVPLISNLIATDENAKAAEKALQAFADRQADIGNFIDRTTGKLTEQNRTLVQNAILLRNARIDANNDKIRDGRDAAFSAARQARILGPTDEQRLGADRGGGPASASIDPSIQRVIRDANGDVAKLDAGLQALAKRRPDLKDVVLQVSNAAGQAVLLARENQKLGQEIDLLTGKVKGQGAATASLVEKQVALETATTPLERARAKYNLVLAKGAAAEKEGGAALEQYRQELTAAANAVNGAEAAEAAARAGRREHNKELREAAKAAREAAKEQRELQATLEHIQTRFDPAAAAARKYADTLADIAKLEGVGKISFSQSIDYTLRASAEAREAADRERADRQRKLVGDWSNDMKTAVDQINDRMDAGMGRAADRFRDRGISAANVIADVLGDKVGRFVYSLSQSANQGRPGARDSFAGMPGISSFLNGRASPQAVREWYATPEGQRGPMPGSQGGFLQGFEIAQTKFTTGIDKVFDRVFGDKGLFSAGFSKTLGQAFGGAQFGGAIGKGVTDALGIKGSATGAKIGGAIGSFLPIPGGEIIGAIAGSIIGGLFKSTPRASATITSVDEKAAVAGNNAGLRQAASGLATSVQGGLQQIADALGGTLGSFAVSIGVRDKSLRVDPSGRGITKTKNGAIDFGQDEGGAIAFAIADAIADGAIAGISPKVAQALRSSDNIDKALKEALNVQALETLLGGIDGAIGKVFKDLERQIAERNRVAQKYGFDLVKLEEQNAKDRKAAFEQVLAERTGPLQALLKDLSFGNLFEGTLAEQRDKLLAEIAKVEADAVSGKDGAAQQLADLRRQLIGVSRDAFGTAGSEYAADVSSSRSAAEQIIALENQRVKEQADLARGMNDKLDTNNRLTDETNDILAEMRALLDRIASNPAAGLGIAFGGGGNFNTERTAML